MLAGSVKDDDFLLESVTKPIALDLEIVARLKIQPKALAGPEVTSKSQGGVGRDGALAVHNLIDSPWRHADVMRKPILGELERLQKIGQ